MGLYTWEQGRILLLIRKIKHKVSGVPLVWETLGSAILGNYRMSGILFGDIMLPNIQ